MWGDITGEEKLGDNIIYDYMSEERRKERLSKFKISCTKCNSSNTELNIYNDTGEDEFEGSYGDAGIVIRCKDCGSTITIEAMSN